MKNFINDLKFLGVDMEALETYYPRITESYVPLSVTGVTPRAYFHWKQEGLIDIDENDTNENRTWVRLNIFQYIWVKIIQSMREFGLPIIAIKNTKEFLFQDILNPIIENKEDYLNFLKTESNLTDEKIAAIRRTIEYMKNQEALPVEYKILTSYLCYLISSALIRNDQTSVLILKNEEDFETVPFSLILINEFRKQTLEIFNQSFFQIPIRPLIAEFFSEPRNEKIIETYGFINPNEQRVLDAIRRNEFKEIVIHFKDTTREELIIEETIDIDIRDYKVKELKRIIGLNEFSEIMLKYRNNKHIFVRTKIKL
jgi:hypothetical protein